MSDFDKLVNEHTQSTKPQTPIKSRVKIEERDRKKDCAPELGQLAVVFS